MSTVASFKYYLVVNWLTVKKIALILFFVVLFLCVCLFEIGSSFAPAGMELAM